MKNLENLIIELCNSSNELPYLEFKHDNYNPDTIGENISALSNSAALYERDFAYMLWGVKDDNHEIVGTRYNLHNLKVGAEELENWLRRLLSPNTRFEFNSAQIQGKTVGILKIYSAVLQTVTFKKIPYIRVVSYTKKLKDYPALESSLWKNILTSKFEEQVALDNLHLKDVFNLLNVSPYLQIQKKDYPVKLYG